MSTSVEVLKKLMGSLLASTPGVDLAAPLRGQFAEPLLDAIDIGIFVIDVEGALLYLNAAWTRLTGRAVDVSLGRPLLIHVHPSDAGTLMGLLDARRHGNGEPTSIIVRLLTRTDDCVRVELRADVLTADDDAASITVGTLTDVSRRVRDEELKQASHRTLETLINNLPGMVYRGRNNPQWTMEFVSDGCQALTGYPPEAFINNRQIAFAELIYPEDRARVWDDVQTALRENRAFELVYRIRTAQGAEKWVLERGRGNIAISGELLGLEGFITDVTAKKRAELRLQHNSMHDSATDLPARPLFVDRLEVALRRARANPESKFALMLLYLDRYAKIRSRFGPDFSDRVALDLSRRFQRLLGPVDSICRWHDDEFAILLDNITTHRDVAIVARQLQEALQTPIVDQDTKIFLTASIGVALNAGGDQRSEDLLHDVAGAMMRAKELGGARHEFFHGPPRSKTALRSEIEVELQAALDNAQLGLHAAPVARIADKVIIGFELRPVWRHPRRGVLQASEFFAAVEDAHFIEPVKAWYLRTLPAQISAWRPLSSADRAQRLHIEIPSGALLEPDYLSELLSRLQEAAAGTFRLALEIRADLLSGRHSAQHELLDLLHTRAVDLIADDMGAGAAPLAVLHGAPHCWLRLSESGVAAGCEEGSLTRGILELARQLRLPVIAQGVRSETQLAALSAAGCEFYQGSLLAPAADVTSATHWLQKGEPAAATAARTKSDPSSLH